MISLLLLFACAAKTIKVGIVDITEEKVCVVQLVDETILEIESDLCASFREGDTITVIRNK